MATNFPDDWDPDDLDPEEGRVPHVEGLEGFEGCEDWRVPVPDPLSEVESDLAVRVWRATRPGWTQHGWVDAEVRPEVRILMGLPLGPALQTGLLKLEAADRAAGLVPGQCPFPHTIPTLGDRVGVPGRPCACQIIVIAAWNALASWVTQRADDAVVSVACREPFAQPIDPERPEFGVITDPAVEEIATALRLSPVSTRNRVAGMRRVASLPRLHAAVRSGTIVGWHASCLATDLRHVSEAGQVRVFDHLLDRLSSRREKGLREWTLSDLRLCVKRYVARLGLDLAAQRKDCHRTRGVRIRSHGDGAATISADLADDVAARIFHRLTALAYGLDGACDGDEGKRSLEQRRADVFTDLLLDSPFGQSPDQSGVATVPAGSEVAVVIDLPTLLRMADHPGEMPGSGGDPVAAEIVRQLAADAKWRAWITTTSKAGTQVIATSPGTYRPGDALARLIRAREPYCRMPGCRSTMTDLDHVVPFPKGPTTLANLGPACRRHHRMKTHTRWRQVSNSDDPDAWTWTTPTGIAHTDHPEPPPDWDPVE